MLSARELEYPADDMEKMTRLAEALETAASAQSSGDSP
jgi:hypothetical protein